MGWLSDLWTNITKYISDKIVGTIAAATEMLDRLRVSWIVFKHRMRLKIAGWLEDDTNLVIAILSIVAVTILVVKNATLIMNSAFVLGIKALLEAVRNGTGNILALAQYQVLLVVHQVSMALFEPYRLLMQDFYTALAAMSAELAQDAEFVNLAFRAAQGVYVSSYAMLGVPMPVAEEEFLKDMGAWTERFERRFRKYAKDPEQIFIDIDAEIVGPAVADGSTGIAALYKSVSDITDDVNDFVTRMDNLRGSVDTFIDTLPDEINTVVAPKWEGITAKYDGIMDEYVRPTLDAVNDSIDIIDAAIKRNDVKIAAIEARQRELLMQLYRQIFPNGTLDMTAAQVLAHLAGIGFADTISQSRSDIEQLNRWYDRRYESIDVPPKPLPLLMIEEKPFTIPPDPLVEERKTPFVGDY